MPWPDYDLAGFFHANLASEDAVHYRQEVLRNLEQAPVLATVRGFTQRLLEMRRHLLFAGKCGNAHSLPGCCSRAHGDSRTQPVTHGLSRFATPGHRRRGLGDP